VEQAKRSKRKESGDARGVIKAEKGANRWQSLCGGRDGRVKLTVFQGGEFSKTYNEENRWFPIRYWERGELHSIGSCVTLESAGVGK